MSAGRALIVAYNFPPSAAIGTMRTLRLVERLAADGWDVHVLTTTTSSYHPHEPIDPDLDARVPDSVRVTRVRVWRPIDALVRRLKGTPPASAPDAVRPTAVPAKTQQAGGVARRLISAFDVVTSIPDSEVGWIVPLAARAIRLTGTWRPDVVYSTAPSWSTHVAALALAKARRLSWVADFRDPWARAPWRDHSPWLAARARIALERRVIHRATAVVFNTTRARQEFAGHYGPALASKFHLIANGCDVFDPALPPRRADGAFVLLHAGSLYGQRTPAIVLRALSKAIRRGAVTADRIKLRLVGLASPPTDLIALAQSLGLATALEIVPRVPRRQALAEMAGASALLLLQQGHALSVPAKTYEYLAAGRPILAIADEGATADVIRESGAGTVVDGQDVDAVEEAILRLATTTAETPPRVAREVYDGAARAAELAAVLGAIAHPTRDATPIPVTTDVRTRRAS